MNDKRIIELAIEALKARIAAIDPDALLDITKTEAVAVETPAQTARGMRKKRTAAQRKAISVRMREIWAAKKAKAAKPAAAKAVKPRR